MILDKECQLMDSQAITADAVSANTYDTALAARDVGMGEPMGIVFNVEVAADFTTGNETYTFQAIEDDDVALGSPTVLAAVTVVATLLTVGKRVVVPIPPGLKTLRYIGAAMDVGGTTPTITVSAHIQPMNALDLRKDYAKNYTVL
jgi:hypothetical protein